MTATRIPAALVLAALFVSHALAAKPPIPPSKNITGTWSGALTIGGSASPYSFQFHRRGSGKIMGYVLGGTNGRTVTGGFQTPAGDVTLTIELADPGFVRTFNIVGSVSGNSLTGTADDGSGPVAISWTRVRPELSERRWLFAKLSGAGEPENLVDVSVVQRKGSGAFSSGGFVSRDGCNLFACGGVVTSLSQTEDAGGNEVIEIGLATGGACPGTGSLQVTFDAVSRFYSGSYSFSDCGGLDAGNLIGARNTRTTSRHAGRVLATYAQLADDLEAEISFTAPYAPFSPAYSHLGETLADRLAELNDQVAAYSAINVDFSRFRNIFTLDDPDILPELRTQFGVDFHDRRSGTAGGGAMVYRDVDTRDGQVELKYIAQSGKDWVIHGNQIVHDLPLAGYSFGPENVIAPTAGGNIFVSIGPWGAHVGPHTGHLEGNAKADWLGLYANRLNQLTELAGDGDGICENGETCGLPQAYIDARIVSYVAPTDNFVIDSVVLERLHAVGEYYGSTEHWRVRGRAGNYAYAFVHLRQVAPALRDAMLAAGYVDPWTVHAPSDNLITGASVPLAKGETIAIPQTVAEPVPGHPGYYTGKWAAPVPWQQMEFFTFNNELMRNESFYSWLAPALESQLAAILQAEGLSPLSFRYNQPFIVGTERMWRGEMALSNQEWSSFSDYSGILSALGGWWETTGGECDGISNQCDELFSIFPLRKDTVFYDPLLYHSADVSYLATHRFRGEMPATQYGEVISPATIDPVSGTLVFKWYDFNGLLLGYQGASYRVDTASSLLRMAWGPVVAAEGLVLPPAVPANTDVCNGTTLTCHNHNRNPQNL